MRTRLHNMLRMNPATTGSLLFMALSPWSTADIAYSLAADNDTWPADKRAAIISAMDEAVAFYNANGHFNKSLTVDYVPSVPTADANYAGSIRFGGQISTRTAMHEISHTLGVGTVAAWGLNIADGSWTGAHANARLELYNGPTAVMRADSQHFWSSSGDSYGLNYSTHDSPLIRIRHVRMVSALRRDMGIVVDSDSDGLPDDWETFYFNSLSFDGTGDADGDTVVNLDEYNADTDPTEAGLSIVNTVTIENTAEAAGQSSYDFGPAVISAFSGEGAVTPNALIGPGLGYIGVDSSAWVADNNVNTINDTDGVQGGADQDRLRIAIQPDSALTELRWKWSRANGPLATDGVSISGFKADPGAVFSGGISEAPTYSGGVLRFQISAFNGTEHTVRFSNHEAARGTVLEITAADSDKPGAQFAVSSLSFTSPDVLFYSDFNNASGATVLAAGADNHSGSSTVSVPWIRKGTVTSISDLSVVIAGDSGTDGGFVELYEGAAPCANNDNIFVGRNHYLDTDRSTARRGFSMNFTVASARRLDQLTVLSGHANGNGVDQGYSSTLVYRLSGGTLPGAITSSSVEDYTASIYNRVEFDLAGIVIGAGTYTLEVYQTEFQTGGAFAIFNGLALEAVNAAPTPGIKKVGVLQDVPVVLPAGEFVAVASDLEGDAIHVSSVTNTSVEGGSIVFSDGDITYTPPSGHVGTDAFSYTLTDARGGSSIGTVHINIVGDTINYNRLTTARIAGDAIEFGYQGLPWASYTWETATNLTGPVEWIPIYTNRAGSDGWLNYTNSTLDAQGYCRVREMP